MGARGVSGARSLRSLEAPRSRSPAFTKPRPARQARQPRRAHGAHRAFRTHHAQVVQRARGERGNGRAEVRDNGEPGNEATRQGGNETGRQRGRQATSQQDEREARALARAGDSGVATDGARDTSQIDVTALHERDRVITEGLHEARACQRSMRLSTPVSHSGRSPPGRPTASPARVRTSPGVTRSRIPVAPAGTRCEAHHETSVRPPRARPWRSSSRRATNRPGRPAVPWPEPAGNLPSIRAATAPTRLRPAVHHRAVITARHSSVRPWRGFRGRIFRSPAGRPQFGPVVDLAYTRWRAPW